MQSERKGYLYGFLAVIVNGLNFLFNKLMLGDVAPVTAAFISFTFATIWAYALAKMCKDDLRGKAFKENWKAFIWAGITIGISSILWYIALSIINASTSSFLSQMSTIFMVIFGVAFLKESFNRIEFLGMMIAILGALSISYGGNAFELKGTLLMVFSTFFFALHSLIVKKSINKVQVKTVVFYRCLFALPIIYIVAALRSELVIPSLKQVFFLAMIPLNGIVLNNILRYEAFKHLDLSKASTIFTLVPFFVVILSFFFLNEVPSFKELMGGMIVILGIIVMIFSKHIHRKTKDILYLLMNVLD